MDSKEFLLLLAISVGGSLAGAFAGGLFAYKISMKELLEHSKRELRERIGSVFYALSTQAGRFLEVVEKLDKASPPGHGLGFVNCFVKIERVFRLRIGTDALF